MAKQDTRTLQVDKALESKVRLVIHTSPMEDKRKIQDVPYMHQSVLELLEASGYAPAFIDNPDYAHIWLNDKPIRPEDFETTYPAEGDILIAKLTPGVTVAGIVAAISASFGAASGVAAAAAAALSTTVVGSITVGGLVICSISQGRCKEKGKFLT
ncbi:hypothetical protein LCGC14_2816440 [marine sediment metagenome]|uniref:Uncharacterized protein n=1 Tax=marine sediment metagenome TaxID=412755 RepID=A0A0F8YIB7_9ZZZZ